MKKPIVTLIALLIVFMGITLGIISYQAIGKSSTHFLDGDPGKWLPGFDDIPAGLNLEGSGAPSNEEAAKGASDPSALLLKLESWGRVGGYWSKYSRHDYCNSKDEIHGVYVGAVLYKTVEGARQAYDWYRGQAASGQDTTGVGEAVYYRIWEGNDNCDPPKALRTLRIDFNEFNASGYVVLVTIKGMMADDQILSQAIKLARVIDKRMIDDAR